MPETWEPLKLKISQAYSEKGVLLESFNFKNFFFYDMPFKHLLHFPSDRTHIRHRRYIDNDTWSPGLRRTLMVFALSGGLIIVREGAEGNYFSTPPPFSLADMRPWNSLGGGVNSLCLVWMRNSFCEIKGEQWFCNQCCAATILIQLHVSGWLELTSVRPDLHFWAIIFTRGGLIVDVRIVG